MILFGLLQEKYEEPGNGQLAAVLVRVVRRHRAVGRVVIYTWAPGLNVRPPAFVYGIIITLFVFFNCFAVNMVLQYKKVGPWRDYLFGEKAYILLSLTAKALLAWQVFFPVLTGAKK